MSLKTQLTDDMKQAMRDRNSVKLNTIRFMLSELKNYEIDNGEQDDAGVQKLIAKQVKQMKDAMAEFQQGGREDLVAEEQAKVVFLEAYLPAQMSDADLEAIVKRVIEGASDKSMGAIMNQVRAEVGGAADGGKIAQIVKAHLQ
ncbi:MAG TPA: GatB/YqeY domain-containing protein [Vitreimonas sp.]|nr:GatB/YqeY domain-containing protein [Vitreimonas sp.]